MTLNDYLNYKKDNTYLDKIYGTENTSNIIASFVNSERPNLCLEIGTGLGVSTFKIGSALKNNKQGLLITIDDGRDWNNVKEFTPYPDLDYYNYINKLIDEFALKNHISFINEKVDYNLFYIPKDKIDLIFFDAWDSNTKGVFAFLKFYLPLMNAESSILIDNGLSYAGSCLIIKNIINHLNSNNLPQSLIEGISKEKLNAFKQLIEKHSFNLFTIKNKNNKHQSSLAWIQLQKKDCLPSQDFIW